MALLGHDDGLIIREDGTRHQGCDESSGWIWYASRQLEETLIETNGSVEGLRVLEIGSGTGWLALRLAMRGAHVTATERHGALPLLFKNVWSNQERIRDLKDGSDEIFLNVVELDWNENTRLEGAWDLAMGSDVLYIVEHHKPLLETLIRHDCKHCVLAWEQRKVEEEERFFPLALDMGFEVKHRINAGVNPSTNNLIWVVFLDFSKVEN